MMQSKISIIPFPFFVEKKNSFLSIPNKNIQLICEKSDFQDTFFYYLQKASYKCNLSSSPSKDSLNIFLKNTTSYNDKDLTNTESYCLEISDSNIYIYASSKAGFFYGIQSLTQLLLSNTNELPCVFIYDKPEFEWRGFSLDCCRSFYTVSFIKKTIDACAFHKLNRFHWHLTDDQGWRFSVPEYPLLTTIGSKRWGHYYPPAFEGGYDTVKIERKYYTDQEIQDIVKYAEQRHITIVPEVEFPGHVSALLASYPEFGCTNGPYSVENRWGIFPDVLCLGNDDIFKIYDSILSKIEKLFPSPYLHIGGDECPSVRWENCPKCQQRIKNEKLENSSQLQSWATKKMVELVIKHKKIPIGWDEVLDNTEKIPLPKNLIVQSWRDVEGGEKAVKLQNSIIMSPQTHCYLNFKNYPSIEEPGRLGVITVEKSYSYTPITSKMSADCKKYVLGGECLLWSEALPSSKVAEYMLFPRLCAISEGLWLSEKYKNFERFSDSLEDHKNRLSKLDYLYYNGVLK